jgi:hypothetical protein
MMKFPIADLQDNSWLPEQWQPSPNNKVSFYCAIMAAQETDLFATSIRPTLINISIADMSQWKSINRALTCHTRINGPCVLVSKVTSHFNDNPKSGHFEALKTGKLVS